MKITQAISMLQALLQQSGDMEIIDQEGFSISEFREADAEDHRFPKDWYIPAKFVLAKNAS